MSILCPMFGKCAAGDDLVLVAIWLAGCAVAFVGAVWIASACWHARFGTDNDPRVPTSFWGVFCFGIIWWTSVLIMFFGF